jgi:hypothetical protein
VTHNSALWRIYVASKNESAQFLHINSPMVFAHDFLSNDNQAIYM